MLCNQRGESLAENESAITKTVALLKEGRIIAIKGVGGYHLACDAYQESAILQLRFRKKRPQRPLAVMAKSLEVARELCHISNHEEEMLTSPERPIVILQRKSTCLLPNHLSPGLTTLGIMLPYTPLHDILFMEGRLDCIVMTSANPSGFPIQYEDDSLERLNGICDYFLIHDQEISYPLNDSVVQCDGENMLFVRRARGFVSDSIKTRANVEQIIALGGNQKNTFAVGTQNQIILSPHIGDLDNEEMIRAFEEQLAHYKNLHGIKRKYVAVDKHPLYASASIAKKLDSEIIPVQHHHAHHVSCMEDNGLKDPCFGIILDGTGYGEDGHIWGFEFLYGDANSFERLAHLQYTPLPGGEQAVEEPWRNAVGMLFYYWPKEGKELATKLFPEKLNEINIIEQMIKNQINTSMAGTCGRLFDAVSAILGICSMSTYEGEAAIKLSDYTNRADIEWTDEIYPFYLKANHYNELQLDLSPMIHQIIQDRLNGKPTLKIIQTFHRTIVSCSVHVVQNVVKGRPNLNKTVVLSGGSFQNLYLLRGIRQRLQNEGFHVYTHRRVPCHDGGLSLGQMSIASHMVAKTTSENERL